MSRPNPPTNKRRDRAIASSIEHWFESNARAFPWRTTPRNPYFALVSEAMLLQTQASRIAERFPVFIHRFPTVDSLASADEQDVLAQWSGLGYYRRAKNLHRAAQQIVEAHGGIVPREIEQLRRLPGVGRYTAGSIASIVFDEPASIVDGNVSRVLLRVEGCDWPPTASATTKMLWTRAQTLVEASDSPAAFNEGLMELGARVCSPKSPDCGSCPVRTRCIAKREKKQHEIPRPKPRPEQTLVHAASVIIRDARGRALVEKRGESGMWAGLWQAPTVESEQKAPTRSAIEALAQNRPVRKIASFEHLTSHRRFHFTVYSAPPPKRRRPDQRWLTNAQIAELALARPQMRILLGQDRVASNRVSSNGGRARSDC